ncbi:hypothetical protein Tco_0097781 [Tanacetum coccineum]
MLDDDWGLESKEVSPLGEELSLFDRPNKVERGRILEAHRLEPILQQKISQCMAPSHHDGRKAHLLEDKQIPIVREFDEVFSTVCTLGKYHGTWVIWRRKRTRLRETYTKSMKNIILERGAAYVTCNKASVRGIHLVTAGQRFSDLRQDSKSHKVLGIASVAIIDRQLPFEYTIASRSTDVMVNSFFVIGIRLDLELSDTAEFPDSFIRSFGFVLDRFQIRSFGFVLDRFGSFSDSIVCLNLASISSVWNLEFDLKTVEEFKSR